MWNKSIKIWKLRFSITIYKWLDKYPMLEIQILVE